jgi:hypothetical protein
MARQPRKLDVFERVLAARARAAPATAHDDARGNEITRGAIVRRAGSHPQPAITTRGSTRLAPSSARGIVQRTGWVDATGQFRTFYPQLLGAASTAVVEVDWPSGPPPGLSPRQQRTWRSSYCYTDQPQPGRLIVVGHAHHIPKCEEKLGDGAGWSPRPIMTATTAMAKWASEMERIMARLQSATDLEVRAILEARAVKLDHLMAVYGRR